MSEVFLSYKAEDRARLKPLVVALEADGCHVWWDAQIGGGADWREEILGHLDGAHCVIVAWSERSVGHDGRFVRDEATRALRRGAYIAICIDTVEPPLGFGELQAIPLQGWKGNRKDPRYQVLLTAVRARLAGEAPPPIPAGLAPPRISRRAAIAGGGAAVLAVGGGATLAWQQGWLEGGSSDTSIAVLPFKNLSGDAAQAYLSEGITEEIRTALRRIPALRVLGSKSSSLAAENGGGAKSIAQKLDVTYLLDGSVQRAGEMLRVGADLTDGRTGFSKWSNQLDRPMADIFAVQREIAQMVAGAMEARIATAKPEGGGTVNVAAYENYLRAREKYFNSTGEDDNRAALALLDLAVAADPNFAKAHALRSRCLNFLAATLTSPSEAKPYFDQATEAAQHALKMAPDLPDAHLAVGNALSGRLNLRGSLPYYKRALELAPGDADILKAYAGKMSNFGETGVARQAATKAALLDPLNHLSFAKLGDIEVDANQYRTAIGHYEKALSLNPKAGFSHAKLALCHLLLGDAQAALKAAEKEPRPYMRLAALAIVRRKLGDEGGAVREFLALKDLGQVAYQEAQVLAQWGDKEAAVEALERAVGVGDQGVLWAKTDPLLIPLRGNPRYTAVLKQIGLV
jgi:serine/threonine-protein kinase